MEAVPYLMIGRTHYRYTQYFNFTYQRSGHLWQNRFYSCALDEAHYWKALCYVERNPVRAHMVEAATAYRWSSAAAHLGASDETGLLDIAAWQARMPAEDWCERLGLPEEETEMAILRCTTHTGRPLGGTEFLLPYEELLGRRLHPLSVGRPKKMKGERYGK